MKFPKWVLLGFAAAAFASGCFKQYPNKHNIETFLTKAAYESAPVQQAAGFVEIVERSLLNYKYDFEGVAGYSGQMKEIFLYTIETDQGEIRILSSDILPENSIVTLNYKVIPGGKLSSEDYVDIIVGDEIGYAEDNITWMADGILMEKGILMAKQVFGQTPAKSEPARHLDTMNLEASIDQMIEFAGTKPDSNKRLQELVGSYKTFVEYSIEKTAKSAEEKISFIRKYEELSKKLQEVDKGYLIDLYITAGLSSTNLNEGKKFLDEAHLYAATILAEQRKTHLGKLAQAYSGVAEKPGSKPEVYAALTTARGICLELGYEKTHPLVVKLNELQQKLLEVKQ